jgi:lipoprotein NlpD
MKGCIIWRRALLAFILTVSAAIWLSGCVRNDDNSAPVINGWRYSQAHSPAYRVRAHDTLYSIAWSYGLDYRALAAANNLPPPYHIVPGQTLNMVVGRPVANNNRWAQTAPRTAAQPSRVTYQRPRTLPPPRSVVQPAHNQVRAKPMSSPTMAHRPLNQPVYSWLMPARGRIVKRFSNMPLGNKGIDIAGSFNEPVIASAAGEVVYAGAGVRGYGNLIILKHNESYLSAYAYNQRVLVKEGSWVQKGQKIGTMGRTDAGTVLLHFEIRHDGKPVNPLLYLR